MWWTDDGHRKTHRRRDPTSFSPSPGSCCRMKPLSTTRNLCASWHARSLCALLLYKTRLPTFFSLLSARVLLLPHFSLSHGRLLCSVAQLRRISIPHLPSIEFPYRPRPPQSPAASFKRLYRTRAEHLARLRVFVKTRVG